MSSVETSSIVGFRGRGGALDAGTAGVALFLLGAAMFLLIGCLQSKNFAQLTVEGMALGSVYGSLALALVLVYRATHVINFAQGELAMLTTYIAYALGLRDSHTGRRSPRRSSSPSLSARCSRSP